MGTYGSRSTALAGAAVFVAAGRLRKRILQIAAEKLEVAATDLELRGDSVSVPGAPGKRLTLREVFECARAATSVVVGRPPGLVEHEYFVAEEPSFPYGVHCAAVEVDLESGAIEIERYLVTCDVGRALNPALVEAQLVGGVVQGIGGAVLEQLAYDESGQLLTSSFAGYLLPTAPDVPPIDVVVDEHAPAAGNPLGLKGAGESGTAAVGATIASAVSAALGVQVTRLPLTPERVVELAATLVPG
jgi:carbon-monoxide dehydrogenase large subunit/6-hydroxypseudooxynicotine dehydrogenase subunit gamma